MYITVTIRFRTRHFSAGRIHVFQMTLAIIDRAIILRLIAHDIIVIIDVVAAAFLGDVTVVVVVVAVAVCVIMQICFFSAPFQILQHNVHIIFKM